MYWWRLYWGASCTPFEEESTSVGVVIGTALSASIASILWALISTLVRFHPTLSIGKDFLAKRILSQLAKLVG